MSEYIQHWLQWHKEFSLVVMLREDGKYWAGLCPLLHPGRGKYASAYSTDGESIDLAIESLNTMLYEQRVDAKVQ